MTQGPKIAGQDTTDSPQPLSENARLLRAEHSDPLGVLGPHVVERDGAARLVVRTIQPFAAEVAVLIDGETIPAARVEPEGIFEALLPARITGPLGPERYRLRIRWNDGNGVRAIRRPATNTAPSSKQAPAVSAIARV